MFVPASLVLAMSLFADPEVSAAAPCGHNVSVRLHDYAGVSSAELLATEAQVSAIYGAIGIRLIWRLPARPDDVKQGRAEWPADPTAEVTVLIVTSERRRSVEVPPEVVGYAAVSGNGGHLVFIVADRTQRIAAASNVPHPRVLSGVIAHELAHLFMPQRPHTRQGIMRAFWSPFEFRLPLKHAFSSGEADEIRRTVSRLPCAANRADH
jgi:hypothetical protein